MILLDTSVMSQVFRRRREPSPPEPAVNEVAGELQRLMAEDRPLGLPGIVLQELLSGVRTDFEFRRLRRALKGFPLLIAAPADHLLAARIANACRASGIAATAVDCLIAAQTVGMGASLYSLDHDFERLATCCTLQLWARPDQVS
ncbi:MAG TPA: PIN domain-containing protein [Thermoanaerobaculia bacterium]|nr:PIN domain-containing protein [Thermoanaerobaculia bacterium]